MREVKIDSDFHGPGILELRSILDDIPDPIEVTWQGTKAEVALLEGHPKRSFVLYVNNLATAERAASAVGASLNISPEVLQAGKQALVSKSAYNWREFADKHSSSALVLKLTSEALRQGKKPRLAEVAGDCCLRKITSPVDADVLLRVKALQNR